MLRVTTPGWPRSKKKKGKTLEVRSVGVDVKFHMQGLWSGRMAKRAKLKEKRDLAKARKR